MRFSRSGFVRPVLSQSHIGAYTSSLRAALPCQSTKITISRGTLAPCGFSLLELLVVIVLIGLLSTVAVLTLPSDNSQRELRQVTERLAAYFRYARQEAVFSGTTHGILWRDNRPLLVKRSVQGWDVQSDSRTTAVQEAAAEFEMYLRRQQELIDLSRSFETPQILFTNDGQVSPFELIIRSRDGSEQVLTDSLSLEEPE